MKVCSIISRSRAQLLFFITALLILMSSCSDERMLFVQSVDPEGWDDTLCFEVDNKETNDMRDLTIFMRFQKSEAPQHVALRVVVATPDGVSVAERIEVNLRDNTKQLRGDRLLVERIYRENIRWNQNGIYRVYIYPIECNQGIEAVGLNFLES